MESLVHQAAAFANGYVCAVNRGGMYNGRMCNRYWLRKNGGRDLLHMAHPAIFPNRGVLDPRNVLAALEHVGVSLENVTVDGVYGDQVVVVVFCE